MRRRGSLSGVRAASRGEVVGLTWHLHNIEDGGENLGTVGMFPKWCFNVGFDFSYRHQFSGGRLEGVTTLVIRGKSV